MDEEKSVMLPEEKAEEGAVPAPRVMPYKPDAKAPLTRGQFWRVLLSIEISMLAVVVDIFSIPVAVPTLSSDALGYLDSAWLATAFLLSFALGFLIWPRLCRGFSYKFSLVIALDAFTVAASKAPPSLSKTAGRLIAMRVISGAGAGGTYGLFDMILRDIVPPKEVEKYLSVSRMIWAVTAVASPLMAGALVDNNIGLSCFDLSVFPGMIGYIMIFFFLNLPEPSWTDTWLNLRQFDYLGTLCLTAGTACMLLVPASSGTLPPWISGHPVGILISGLALLTAFFFIEPLVPDPLLSPSLFLNPGQLVIMVAAFFHGANLFGTLYYVPHFFQLVLEDSAVISSISTLPMIMAMAWSTVAMFMTSPCRTSFNIVRVGAASVALASSLMVLWSTSTSREETAVVLALLGLGQGTALVGLLRTAQAAGSQFTRVFTFVHVLGSAFGVALFSAPYVNKLQSLLRVLVPDVAQTLADTGKIDGELCAGFGPRVRDAFGWSMQAGWWLMLACALTVLALSFLVEPSQLRKDGDSSRPVDGEKVSEAEKGF